MTTLRRHWPFMLVAIIGAGLIFTNLGSGYLWADEGDTAVLASNILKFGVPRSWDGVTFMDSDFGARVNNDLVMVSSPWLQYYLAAASFWLFGENTFAARLPFAFAGWLTILLVYRLIWQSIADRRAALCGTILTICSVQFLLFCRQSRYYACVAREHDYLEQSACVWRRNRFTISAEDALACFNPLVCDERRSGLY